MLLNGGFPSELEPLEFKLGFKLILELELG